MENEQAGAGRNGWTRLVRQNSQVRTGTGEYQFSLFSWSRAGLATLPGWSILCYTWWPHIHTYSTTRRISPVEFGITDHAKRWYRTHCPKSMACLYIVVTGRIKRLWEGSQKTYHWYNAVSRRDMRGLRKTAEDSGRPQRTMVIVED